MSLLYNDQLGPNPKVTKIGRRNFEDCDALISITIPDTVTSMGEYMFAYCDNLTSVTLSENLTTLEQAVLHQCPKLETVVIPDSVQAIGKMCFDRSTGLKSVVIGKGVKSIGWEAFQDCTSLTTVIMNDAIEIIDEYAFEGCEMLESIVIPDTTISIGNYAFDGCKSLKTAYIGNSVKTIGTCAFDSCSTLEKIVIPDSVIEIGNCAFQGCSGATVAKIGSNVEKIGIRSFEYCSSLSEIVIPDSVTALGEYAFAGCADAKTAVIGKGVTELKEKAFYGCASLESVAIGEDMTAIGNQVFTDCGNLKKITVAENNPVFSSDDRGVLLDKNKTTLIQAPGAISGSYTMPETVTAIGDHAFYNCKQLEKIIFADGVKTIGSFGFYGCDILEYIDYGNSLESAGSFCFGYCNKLAEVNLPASFKDIGALMYHGCDGLVNLVLPDTVETIGAEAFAYCSNLKTADLGDGVKVIKKAAFEFAEHMTLVTVGDKLETVEDEAFYRCDDLTDVHFAGTSEQWYAIDIVGYDNSRFQYANVQFAGGHEHSYTNYVSQNDATCTEDGTEIAKCDLCYLTNTRPIAGSALGHTGGTATCTTVAICERCGNAYGDKNTANHVHTELQNVKDANCTEDGYTGDQYCLDCGNVAVAGEIVPAYHVYATTVVPATYTEAGFTEYICGICGHNYKDNFTKAKGLPKPVVKATANAATGGATLTWVHDGEADYYEVYRATSKSGKYKLLETVEGTELEVSVSAGKSYYYKAKAICKDDSSLNSSYSSVVKVTGKCAQPVITVVQKASSGKPYVDWEKVSGAEKYDVYRAKSEAGPFTKVKTTTSTSYTDSKAELGVTYYYKVKAIASKSTYNSAYSEVKSCLTILAQPKVTLKTVSSTGKPVVTWGAVSGATGYQILRAESETGVFTELVSKQTELSYTDSSAGPDKDYWYKVNAIGATADQNSIDADAKMIHSALAKPSVTFGVNSITGRAVLSWEKVDGAKEYKIYRSTKSTSSYKSIGSTEELSFTDKTASVGKGYYYKVIAIGENCKSAYSSYKKLIAKCGQPNIMVSVKESSGKPALKWDKVSGAEKYYVYRSTNEAGGFEKVKTTTKTSYTDSAANVGTQYYYKVKAIAAESEYNSMYSEVKSCLTVCARPEVELSTNKTTGKPIVEWEKISGAVSYELYRSENGGEYELISTQTELTYTDENTVVDGAYSYKVKAIANDPALNSTESVEASVFCACEKPSISIVLDGKKPMVSWDSVEGATKYYVYRSTKKSSGYKKVATVELEDGTSYRDSKAKKGTTYYYKIVAVSENAKSAYSNVVKIKSK